MAPFEKSAGPLTGLVWAGLLHPKTGCGSVKVSQGQDYSMDGFMMGGGAKVTPVCANFLLVGRGFLLNQVSIKECFQVETAWS